MDNHDQDNFREKIIAALEQILVFYQTDIEKGLLHQAIYKKLLRKWKKGKAHFQPEELQAINHLIELIRMQYEQEQAYGPVIEQLVEQGWSFSTAAHFIRQFMPAVIPRPILYLGHLLIGIGIIFMLITVIDLVDGFFGFQISELSWLPLVSFGTGFLFIKSRKWLLKAYVK